MLITSLKKQQGTYRVDTDRAPFVQDISPELAAMIITYAHMSDRVGSITRWTNDEVIHLALTRAVDLDELEQAMEIAAEQADYEETIADFVAGTRG